MLALLHEREPALMRHAVERLLIPLRIQPPGVPIVDELRHLIAHFVGRTRTHQGAPLFGLQRELAKESEQRAGERLVRCFCRGLHECEHRVRREMLRRVLHEPLPLLGVASHLEQPVERRGLQRPDEIRQLSRDDDRVFALRSLERLRELHEEADDRLIVLGVALLVERAGEHEGVEQLVASGVAAQHQRGAREGNPDELRTGALVLLIGETALLAHQLEPVVRERGDVDVRPAHRLRGDRDLRLVVVFDRRGVEEIGQLVAPHAGQNVDGADSQAVQSLREFAHERVRGIGGDAADDDLIARDGERDGLSII